MWEKCSLSHEISCISVLTTDYVFEWQSEPVGFCIGFRMDVPCISSMNAFFLMFLNKDFDGICDFT